MANKKGLGRGLAALIPDVDMEILRQVARGDMNERKILSNRSKSRLDNTRDVVSTSFDVEENKEKKPVTVTFLDGKHKLDTTSINIAVGAIEANPYQPRRFFQAQELEDLANSIREHGVLQPIIVRPLADDDTRQDSVQFQLIAGERRWRASQMAGLSSIPAIVRPLNDQQALELALIENVQRHDISSIDAALAYRRLAEEFHLSQEDISKRVGKSRSAVANTMRLLDLQDEIRVALEKNDISEGHGRAILLASGEGARRALFRRIVRDKLSVREAERMAKMSEDTLAHDDGHKDEKRSLPNALTSPDLLRVESGLQKRLGARVKVQARSRGGRIVIEYSSVEELQRIVRNMSGV